MSFQTDPLFESAYVCNRSNILVGDIWETSDGVLCLICGLRINNEYAYWAECCDKPEEPDYPVVRTHYLSDKGVFKDTAEVKGRVLSHKISNIIIAPELSDILLHFPYLDKVRVEILDFNSANRIVLLSK